MRSVIVLALVAIAGCGPAGRQLGSSQSMRRRQDIWERCSRAIQSAQCDEGSGVYQTMCMRQIGDRYFDTRSLSDAQQIAIANGCPESMVGAHASYGGAGPRTPTPRAAHPWSDAEMQDMIARINDAVVSCFAAADLPARIMMTVDPRGHIAQHAIASVHTDDEQGCIARLLVSVDVESDSAREPRTVTARFGEAPAPAVDAAVAETLDAGPPQ